ncbi:hypothetical protein [Sorangium sp. So ce394]|uniref:monooxygenase n=1 Tax=Sorangium sp. So ce394 TaxID=3133310 RepID=UPI003F5BB6AE
MRTTIKLVALLGTCTLVGCTSSPPSSDVPEDDLLAPPPAGAGVQFRMVAMLDPGVEIQRCKLFVVPPEGLNIQRDEVRFSSGSHHVLLYETPYAELPTKTRHGVPIDATQVHDCKDGPQGEWEINGVFAGSQSRDGVSFLGELPPGVAVKVPPGKVLLMNTHYINASAEPIETDARINIYTIPDDAVEIEAGMLFHYNPFIDVPARGESSARMRCTADQDISVVRIQSHTHSRGVGYVAHKVDLDGKMTELYAHDQWENVPTREFSPFLEVKKGEALDYRCDFANAEEREIAQGLTTKDEMCMLIGPYFPRSPMYENCHTKEGLLAATWFGSGATACAETLSCLDEAKAVDGGNGPRSYGCIVNSCEAVGPAISNVIRCQWSAGYGACAEACSQPGEACESCMASACKADLDACQIATCG